MFCFICDNVHDRSRICLHSFQHAHVWGSVWHGCSCRLHCPPVQYKKKCFICVESHHFHRKTCMKHAERRMNDTLRWIWKAWTTASQLDARLLHFIWQHFRHLTEASKILSFSFLTNSLWFSWMPNTDVKSICSVSVQLNNATSITVSRKVGLLPEACTTGMSELQWCLKLSAYNKICDTIKK